MDVFIVNIECIYMDFLPFHWVTVIIGLCCLKTHTYISAPRLRLTINLYKVIYRYFRL